MKNSASKDPLVKKFLNYLTVEKDDSPLTIINYEADICQFAQYMADKGKRFLNGRKFLCLTFAAIWPPCTRKNWPGGPLPGAFLPFAPFTGF